jgi:hypothetical protein
LFNPFDDFCHAVARRLFCYSAVALILLVVAIAIAPLRAEESAAQRPIGFLAGDGRDGIDGDHEQRLAVLQPECRQRLQIDRASSRGDR